MERTALPQGFLPMPGEGFNGTNTTEEVALTTARYNKPQELTNRFFGEINQGTLLQVPFKDGSQVRLHVATGPYTPHHMMIVAHGPDFPNLPKDEAIKAQSLFDYPKKVQQTYWDVLLNGIAAYKDILDSDYRVFSAGNWLNTYSNFDERNARTIGLPHDHICAIKRDQIKEYTDGGLVEISGYIQERDLTSQLLPTTLPRIQEALSEKSSLTLESRTEMPYGYSFTIPAETDITTFADLMNEHHEAYSNTASKIKTIFDKRSTQQSLTQPSYQLYIEIDTMGDRHISISPSFGGAIGALESAGIQSKRDPLYTLPVSSEAMYEARNKVVKKVKERILAPVE